MSSLVLVVEDDQRSRKLACDVARSMELEVIAAESAEEGLSLIEKRLPDIILMDIRLPGMSGQDAFRLLNADSRTCKIPVIAVTASTLPIQKNELLSQGFFDFIAKPYRFIDLLTAIEQALDSKSE